eukprot:NODE_5323_length_669_cov_58.190037_g5160_i0.p1 GENE.NODE_5323_length_669_cov_58.190037_g5160_i0~~NODE_5323_length_669_cov_58.190037_g5160_i0.p1  ORF type:complete len:194 (+),score=35.90 NODE_5323_length_669_cov_58.190037_g5160_i0:48-584(+)
MSGFVARVVNPRFTKWLPRPNPVIRIRCHGPIEFFQREFLGELPSAVLPGAMCVCMSICGLYAVRCLFLHPEHSIGQTFPRPLQKLFPEKKCIQWNQGNDMDQGALENIEDFTLLWGRKEVGCEHQYDFLELLDEEAQKRGYEGVNFGHKFADIYPVNPLVNVQAELAQALAVKASQV